MKLPVTRVGTNFKTVVIDAILPAVLGGAMAENHGKQIS